MMLDPQHPENSGILKDLMEKKELEKKQQQDTDFFNQIFSEQRLFRIERLLECAVQMQKTLESERIFEDEIENQKAKKALHEQAWMAYLSSQKISPTTDEKKQIKDPVQDVLSELENELDAVLKSIAKVEKNIDPDWQKDKSWADGLKNQIMKLCNGIENKMRTLCGLSESQMNQEVHVPGKEPYTLKKKESELQKIYEKGLRRLKENGHPEEDLKKWDEQHKEVAPETKKQFGSLMEELMHVQRRLGSLKAVKEANAHLPPDKKLPEKGNLIRTAIAAVKDDKEVQTFTKNLAGRRLLATLMEKASQLKKQIVELKNSLTSRKTADNIPEAPPLEPREKVKTVLKHASQAYEPDKGAQALLPNQKNSSNIIRKICRALKLGVVESENKMDIKNKGKQLCSVNKKDGTISTNTKNPSNLKTICLLAKKLFGDVVMKASSTSKKMVEALSSIASAAKMSIEAHLKVPKFKPRSAGSEKEKDLDKKKQASKTPNLRV